MSQTNQTSRSKLFLLDRNRGLDLPESLGFLPGEEYDQFGRPSKLNLLTLSEYFSNDIIAADRFFQQASNQKYPMFTHHRIMAREMMLRQFLWVEIMRGGGKTFGFARNFLNYALMVPNTPIILTAPSFRQSLMCFDNIRQLIELNSKNENSLFNIKNEIVGEIKRGTMEALVNFKNGSMIKAVPMGDGQKIRGLRGGLLFVDEAYQVTEELYQSHIAPFVGVRQGDRPSKIVMATTSFYQDSFAYRRKMQIASEMKSGNPLYGMLDFDLDDLTEDNEVAVYDGEKYTVQTRKFPLEPAIWKDAQKHGDKVTYAMTYFNLWPDMQSRWYEYRVIDDSISARHGIKVELSKPKDSKSPYFAIVDLATSDKGDSSFILVAKYEEGKAKFVYGKKGKGWSGHRRAWECHEVIRKFDPQFVIYDSHAAPGVDFRRDMAIDKLVVIDEEGKAEIKSVSPVLGWNEYNLRGQRLLIPVNPKDDAVVMALTGKKDGDLGGEDGMNFILHTHTRNLIAEEKMLGPGADVSSSSDKPIEYASEEQEAFEAVRESFQQLGKITLAKDNQGNQKMTKSGQLVFKRKSGTSVDDGAFCLIYSSIGILRLSGYDNSQSIAAPRIRAMSIYSQRPKLEDKVLVNVQVNKFL